MVRLGEHNLSTKKDCEDGAGCAPPPKDIDIEDIIPHPDYFKPELRNDIALIRLAEKVEIRDCKFISFLLIHFTQENNSGFCI